MEHNEIHHNYHKHVTLWLATGIVALGLLIFVVWMGTNSQNFRVIPAKAQITPTPIVSGNITVNTPHAEAHVAQDFLVTGTSTLPTVGIRLRDKYSGHVIMEGITGTNATQPGASGQYGAQLKITSDTIRSESPLTLEIFEPVGKQERNKIIIPLTFTPIGQ